MITKDRFSKVLSIIVVLGLMLSMGGYNIGGVAFAQAGDTPTLEPTPMELPPIVLAPTELPPTEPTPTEVPPIELPPTELPPTPTALPPTESPTATPTIAPTDTPAPLTDPVHIEGALGSTSGWFSIIWGDGPEGATQMGYTLTNDSGVTPLLLDETLAQSLGGVLSFDRKYVNVEGIWATPLSDEGATTVLNVSSISLASKLGTELESNDVLPLTGTKPWIAIMCKFPDKVDLPKNLAYFQGMDDNVDHRLDHFWRELSYNNIDLIGSNAAGWFTLPDNEAAYLHTNPAGLFHLADDCLAAADTAVNYALYQNGGINMMFNYDWYSGWAWGGSMTKTLDGVTKSWSITWEPPWAYADISVIQHEMGHGFGLPHSSGAYGATYDNAWDVMSKDRYNCAAHTDATYGCIAQQTISYHKDKLGWIPAGQKFTPANPSTTTITLEQLALPATSNYKMAQIPIGGSATHFYTVEARRLTGYDIKLAGAAVIIHEVDTTRSRPAYVLDPDLNGVTSDAGAMWTVGETFTDAANQISVAVLSATATGFTVRIQRGATSSLPPAATLISPSGSISNYTPNYRWNSASGATWYYLWVNGPSGNRIQTWYTASAVGCAGGGVCSVTPATILTGGAHQWWIQTYNSVGYGPWSTGMNFSLPVPGVPPAATLIWPSGSISDTTPTYNWNSASGATYYYLWVNGPSGNRIQTWYTASAVGCSGGGVCSVTPATTLTGGAHQWWIRTYNSVGYGPWSAVMNFSLPVLPVPPASTLISPSGSISDNTPTYRWNSASGATYYYLWVNGPSGNRIQTWYTASQAGCASGGTCSVTPATTLSSGAHQWWIRTWNSVGYGPWSAVMNFSLPWGFNSQFNGNATNWYKPSGDPTVWSVDSYYLYTYGAAGYFTSAYYNEHYGDLDYTAKLWRSRSSTYANTLLIRGDPTTLTSDRGFANAYYFEYTSNGWYSIWKRKSGIWIALQDWTYTSAISQGSAWNTLRVWANGNDLWFSINGIWVKNVADSTFTSNHVGIAMYRSTAAESLWVDWATLTPLTSGTSGTSANLSSEGMVISAEQLALNAAANQQPAASGNPMMAPSIAKGKSGTLKDSTEPQHSGTPVPLPSR